MFMAWSNNRESMVFNWAEPCCTDELWARCVRDFELYEWQCYPPTTTDWVNPSEMTVVCEQLYHVRRHAYHFVQITWGVVATASPSFPPIGYHAVCKWRRQQNNIWFGWASWYLRTHLKHAYPCPVSMSLRLRAVKMFVASLNDKESMFRTTHIPVSDISNCTTSSIVWSINDLDTGHSSKVLTSMKK